MTPAGTSNELDVQNGWEENTHTHCMYICICVCCYSSSSRLAEYVASISSIVLIVTFMEECTFSSSEMMFFYFVTRGWNLTSAYYVIIQSINIRRHIERRHVNREEFRE